MMMSCRAECQHVVQRGTMQGETDDGEGGPEILAKEDELDGGPRSDDERDEADEDGGRSSEFDEVDRSLEMQRDSRILFEVICASFGGESTVA